MIELLVHCYQENNNPHILHTLLFYAWIWVLLTHFGLTIKSVCVKIASCIAFYLLLIFRFSYFYHMLRETNVRLVDSSRYFCYSGISPVFAYSNYYVYLNHKFWFIYLKKIISSCRGMLQEQLSTTRIAVPYSDIPGVSSASLENEVR